MLHEENAHILSLLPSLASGLFTRVDYLDVIIDFITQEKAKVRQSEPKLERLTHVEKQLREVHISTPKYSLGFVENNLQLLAYAFGDIFTPALALITGRHIAVQLLGIESVSSCLGAIETFLKDPNQSDPIFFEVTDDPIIVQADAKQDVNPFLRLREMLSGIGICLNLTTFDVSQPGKSPSCESDDSGTNELKAITSKDIHLEASRQKDMTLTSSSNCKLLAKELVVPGNSDILHEDLSKVLVDPVTWFCSCNSFTDKSFISHSSTGHDILVSSSFPSLIAKFFEAGPCKYPVTLPFCKHLLAVLVMLLNWSAVKDAGLVCAHSIRSETVQSEVIMSGASDYII